MLPICFGALNLSLEQIGNMTPYELINRYHGYLWRQERKEEMIAQFVTLWIANTAGKTIKKTLSLKDIFKDGRFNAESFEEFLEEFDREEG